MLMNGSVFMCAKDRQIRANVASHIGDRVSGRTRLDETNHRRIVHELIGHEIDELMSRPHAHFVDCVSEVSLANGPVDRMACLDDIEHVERGAKDPLEIERIFDHTLGVLGKIRRNENLGQFVEAKLSKNDSV